MRVDVCPLSPRTGKRETRVRPFPISIDFDRFEAWAQAPQTEKRLRELWHNLNLRGGKVGLAVERLDYT